MARALMLTRRRIDLRKPIINQNLCCKNGGDHRFLCINARHTSSCMCVGFLRSPQSLTYCKILGIRLVTAFLQLELFMV
ncbi:hypothetical protein DJ61_4249 [Yersinia enterocolitica]|nr:hypothetical protein DJ61_4249 [Yersinia enterocolitica]